MILAQFLNSIDPTQTLHIHIQQNNVELFLSDELKSFLRR